MQIDPIKSGHVPAWNMPGRNRHYLVAYPFIPVINAAVYTDRAGASLTKCGHKAYDRYWMVPQTARSVASGLVKQGTRQAQGLTLHRDSCREPCLVYKIIAHNVVASRLEWLHFIATRPREDRWANCRVLMNVAARIASCCYPQRRREAIMVKNHYICRGLSAWPPSRKFASRQR